MFASRHYAMNKLKAKYMLYVNLRPQQHCKIKTYTGAINVNFTET